MDQMLVVAQAVRRGVSRALVSVDFPFGPLQEGTDSAVRAAIRLVKEAGVDLVKLDGAADFPDAVTAVTRAGIPVFAQFGITPQTALRLRRRATRRCPSAGDAGARWRCRTRWWPRPSGWRRPARRCSTSPTPVRWSGAAVAEAVSIPVLGGFGGGPWLDGRMRMAHAAIGYAASAIDNPPDTYANVAQITLDAITAYAEDVRAARQIGRRHPGSAGHSVVLDPPEGRTPCPPPSSTASPRATRWPAPGRRC